MFFSQLHSDLTFLILLLWSGENVEVVERPYFGGTKTSLCWAMNLERQFHILYFKTGKRAICNVSYTVYVSYDIYPMYYLYVLFPKLRQCLTSTSTITKTTLRSLRIFSNLEILRFESIRHLRLKMYVSA